MTPTNYIAAERSFKTLTQLKVGDKVKVIRTAKDRELGWSNSWNKTSMDKQVGKTLKVASGGFASEGSGIYCNDGYYYPFFCLEVLKTSAPDVQIKLESGSYTATIVGGVGSIKVGCQTLSPAMVDRLYKASMDARKGVAEVDKEPAITAKKKKAPKKVPAKKVPAKKAPAKKKAAARRSIFD